MIRVYVAGPIGANDGGRIGRMQAAAEVGCQLVEAGLAPFVPHLWGLGYEQAFDACDYETWLAYDLAWLLVCDAVLRLPGLSPGADREVQHARDLGIPVFVAVEILLEWARGGVRTPRSWMVGARVTRPIYLDDGTWTREGDACLPGPLKHGAVELREKYGDDMLFHVLWDDGSRGRYFWHGIDAEVAL